MDQLETDVIAGLIHECRSVSDQYSNWSNACENHDLTLGKLPNGDRQGSPQGRRTTDGSAMLK